MTTYRPAKSTEYKPTECQICKDGHLLLIGDNGDRLHELPEPGGTWRCEASKKEKP